MITNIVYLFDTNGLVIGTQQQIQVDNMAVLLNGIEYGFAFCVLLAGFWAVRGIWSDFITGGDRQHD